MARPVYRGGRPFFKPGIVVGFPGNEIHLGYTISGGGAPTNGTGGTGAGKTNTGSWYIDTTAGNWYLNQGTMASPTWLLVPTSGSLVASARPMKIATLALSGTAIHSAAVGLVNPEGADCVITRVNVVVSTVATGAGKMDVGYTASSATTAADNLADGLDVHTGTAPFGLALADQAGANGLTRAYWASGKWVTVSDDATGNVTGLVGTLYVEYFPV